jgi:hypothetical protein
VHPIRQGLLDGILQITIRGEVCLGESKTILIKKTLHYFIEITALFLFICMLVKSTFVKFYKNIKYNVNIVIKIIFITSILKKNDEPPQNVEISVIVKACIFQLK